MGYLNNSSVISVTLKEQSLMPCCRLLHEVLSEERQFAQNLQAETKRLQYSLRRMFPV